MNGYMKLAAYTNEKLSADMQFGAIYGVSNNRIGFRKDVAG